MMQLQKVWCQGVDHPHSRFGYHIFSSDRLQDLAAASSLSDDRFQLLSVDTERMDSSANRLRHLPIIADTRSSHQSVVRVRLVITPPLPGVASALGNLGVCIRRLKQMVHVDCVAQWRCVCGVISDRRSASEVFLLLHQQKDIESSKLRSGFVSRSLIPLQSFPLSEYTFVKMEWCGALAEQWQELGYRLLDLDLLHASG